MKDKERAVYEAVGRLLLNGTDVQGLTVSAIARMAGIGKGTVYEYVASKEELIAKGLAYTLLGFLQGLTQQLHETPGFRAKYNAVLDTMDRVNQCEMFLIVAFHATKHALPDSVAERELAAHVFPTARVLLDELAKAAEADALVSPDADPTRVRSTLTCSLAGYAFLTHIPEMGFNVKMRPADREDVLDMVEGMLRGVGQKPGTRSAENCGQGT